MPPEKFCSDTSSENCLIVLNNTRQQSSSLARNLATYVQVLAFQNNYIKNVTPYAAIAFPVLLPDMFDDGVDLYCGAQPRIDQFGDIKSPNWIS